MLEFYAISRWQRLSACEAALVTRQASSRCTALHGSQYGTVLSVSSTVLKVDVQSFIGTHWVLSLQQRPQQQQDGCCLAAVRSAAARRFKRHPVPEGKQHSTPVLTHVLCEPRVGQCVSVPSLWPTARLRRHMHIKGLQGPLQQHLLAQQAGPSTTGARHGSRVQVGSFQAVAWQRRVCLVSFKTRLCHPEPAEASSCVAVLCLSDNCVCSCCLPLGWLAAGSVSPVAWVAQRAPSAGGQPDHRASSRALCRLDQQQHHQQSEASPWTSCCRWQ